MNVIARLRLRKGLGWTVAGIVVLALTVLVGRATFEQYRLERDLGDRGRVTEGTVVRSFTSFAAKLPQKRTEVQFRAGDDPQTAEMPAAREGSRIGQRMRVRYDPADPNRARPASWSLNNWAAGLVATASGVFIGLVLLGIGRREARRPRRRRRSRRAPARAPRRAASSAGRRSAS